MKYPLIAAKVLSETWAVTPQVMDAIVEAVFQVGRDSGETAIIPHHPRADFTVDVQPDEPPDQIDGETAIVPVFGVIGKRLSSLETMCGGCCLDAVGEMLDGAANDASIRSILLHFHSPGGTVTGVQEMAAKIRAIDAQKPVYAFTDSLCASAAIWLASQARGFFATPSAIVGSVGVYSLTLDYSRQMEQDGVKVNAITNGKFKLLGASFKPLTDEERAMLQTRVDAVAAQFKSELMRHRAIEPDAMQGQIFTGETALAAGFLDGLVDDFPEALALARAAE